MSATDDHVQPTASSPTAELPATASSTAPLLLEYERQLVSEMLEEDSLCITAAGLGWQKVVAVILRLHDYTSPGVLLILGANTWQRQLLTEELHRHDPAAAAPVEITNEVPAIDRIEHYKSRGCCFVTTRILVVDLLSHRVLPRDIAGMVVINAHKVADASGEGFAIRLFRQGNSSGFLRAFSDQPTAFASGFNKASTMKHPRPCVAPDYCHLNNVEKTMKALRCRRLILWPRFHQYVQDELDKHPPQVRQYNIL
eukprot:jgi/Chrzof1/10119/Cz04g29130.t1